MHIHNLGSDIRTQLLRPTHGRKGGERTKDGVGHNSQTIHPRSIDASGRVLPLSSTLFWRRGVGPDVLCDCYLFYLFL